MFTIFIISMLTVILSLLLKIYLNAPLYKLEFRNFNILNEKKRGKEFFSYSTELIRLTVRGGIFPILSNILLN